MAGTAAKQVTPGESAILARVTVDVLVPNGQATEQQISDWLSFYLGARAHLENANPLADIDPMVLPGTLKWDVVRAGVLKISG